MFKGFGMLEYWTHCKNQCFGPTLYWRTRKKCCFWRKDWNNTVRTCVLDRLYAQKCINYVGVEGNNQKTLQNKFWSMFNIFTRTEPKNLRCGRPPTRSGVNKLVGFLGPKLTNHVVVLPPFKWFWLAPAFQVAQAAKGPWTRLTTRCLKNFRGFDGGECLHTAIWKLDWFSLENWFYYSKHVICLFYEPFSFVRQRSNPILPCPTIYHNMIFLSQTTKKKLAICSKKCLSRSRWLQTSDDIQ